MRIISGKYKGTKLYEFEYDNIRPTLDRVREGIFNTLQSRLNGETKVLDLFCGTGAFALEFLSRGVKSVTCVDSSSDSVYLARRNATKCKTNLNIITADYKKALKSLSGHKFDIIFLDPPFASNYAQTAINLIMKEELLSSDGIIVWERCIDTPSENFAGLTLLNEKKYGTIIVAYYGREDD